MTTTELTEVGQSVVANGIRTNYLEAGSGEDVVLIHGSGPGVTSYANWRLVIPALAENFHVVAPDMVGFGFSDRPEGVKYGLDTWADQTVGVMDALGIEKANLVGNSFGGSIALRIATKHPDRVNKLVLMGSMGVHFEITEGLDKVWGYDGTLRGHAQGAGLLRLLPGAGQRRTGQGPLRGQQPARLPGVVLVDVPGAPAALGRRDDHPGRGDQGAAAPHPDRARPGGQGHPGGDLLKLEELLDNADLSVFSHCGHWSMIERTADFNRLVRDFFLGKYRQADVAVSAKTSAQRGRA